MDDSGHTERFEVEFDSDLNRMWAEGTGLAGLLAVDGGARSILGRRARDVRHGPCRFGDCFGLANWRRLDGRMLARQVLTDATAWGPMGYARLALKALVHSEDRFARSYPPLGSHEERLTGHLLSELFAGLRTVAPAVSRAATNALGYPVEMDLVYADLSAGRVSTFNGRSSARETYTGADFALMVVRAEHGWANCSVTAAVFQAKKLVDDRAEIGLSQLVTLLTRGGNGAYYCLYDMLSWRRLAPMVVDAGDLWRDESNPERSNKTLDCDPTAFRGVRFTAQPLRLVEASLAEFLVLQLLLEEVDGAALRFGSMEEARAALMGDDAALRPARVLAVSLQQSHARQEGRGVLDLVRG